MVRSAAVVLLTVVTITSASSIASAQQGGSAQTEEERERARQLFDDARAAFEQGRFAEARELLHESLKLWPHSPTALNLARVLRAIGEPIGAEVVLRQLQAGKYGELEAEQRQNVQSLLDEVRGEISTVELSVHGADRVVVRVDGVPQAEVGEGQTHRQRLDPGSHVILVTTADGRSAERELELQPGATRKLSIGLPPPDTSDGSLLSSPWFWVLTGTAVVAAGVTTTVLLTQPRSGEPVVDPVWGVAEALSAP